jgi:sporulation protein YlmC with PRC-barrel domain
MKKYRIIAPLLIAALLFAACLPADVDVEPEPGVIDETPGVVAPTPMTGEETPQVTPEVETPEVEEPPLPAVDTPVPSPAVATPESTPAVAPEATGPVTHLSTLMDFDITDPQGQRLGDIEDLVVDLSLEVVLYAIANIENQQGAGERTVAIPYNSLRIDRHQQTFPNTFRLNADPQVLAMAPEIDITNTDFTASGWDLEFETFWEDPQAAMTPETPEPADDEAEEADEADEEVVDSDDEVVVPTPMPADARVLASVVLASNLLGAEVVHGSLGEVAEADSENLGTIADIIVDPLSGRTQHLVIEADTDLAVTGDWIPVPMSQAAVTQLATDTLGEDLVVQVEQERLAGAPGYEVGQLPDTMQPGWDVGVIEYWFTQ